MGSHPTPTAKTESAANNRTAVSDVAKVVRAPVTAKIQRPKHKKRKMSKHVAATQQERDSTGKKSTPKSKKRRKGNVVKPPSAADTYLLTWQQHQRDAKIAWKFNKNTQSWLIRHMYEVDKVSKATFGTLLDYLQGMQGIGQERIVEDATKRCLRYKNSVDSSGEPVTTLDNQDRWSQLDDHDKRKEYKRARLLLEVVGKKTSA